MAPRTPLQEERNPYRFSASLSSVVSEWTLIFLLLLNGFFSYLVTKFSRHNKLQTPCVLCSRFDHVLDSDCPSFYDDLICTSHKLEFSSLSCCHIHQKLADIREMCETCLLSFSTKKFNSETYRSLVAKLEINNKDDEFTPKLHEVTEAKGEHVARAPFLMNNDMIDLVRKAHCSCCNEPFRMRSHAHRLLQTKTVGANASESGSPILGLLDRSLSLSRNRDVFSKRKEVLTTPTPTPTPVSCGQHGFDQLEHVGYSELKITSDSESEVPISDDGDGHTLLHRSTNIVEDPWSDYVQNDPPIVCAETLPHAALNGIACEKMVRADRILPDLLLPVIHEQVFIDEKTISSAFMVPVIEEKIHTVDAVTTLPVLLPIVEEQGNSKEQFDSSINVAKLHGLDELNWNEIEGGTLPAESDLLCRKIPLQLSNAKDVSDFSEMLCDPSAAVDATKNCVSTEMILKPHNASNDLVLPISMEIDLNDSYKLLIVAKKSEPSSKDASQIQEDLRLLQTQIFQGLDSTQHDTVPSPRVRGLLREDSRLSDASRTSGQNDLLRGPFESNESGIEYVLDGSGTDEMDGETTVNKPKRHGELDRMSSLLYKELEEERSASAIAANQAMAMITRLQEEKAAMQMEAFQYQRLMEEQAEYDLEALQKLKNLLAENEMKMQDQEKVIQDLKAEVSCYRNT